MSFSPWPSFLGNARWNHPIHGFAVAEQPSVHMLCDGLQMLFEDARNSQADAVGRAQIRCCHSPTATRSFLAFKAWGHAAAPVILSSASSKGRGFRSASRSTFAASIASGLQRGRPTARSRRTDYDFLGLLTDCVRQAEEVGGRACPTAGVW